MTRSVRAIWEWKLEVALKGAKHRTFQNDPLVLKSLGVRYSLDQDGLGSYGTTGGKRGLEIISMYASKFAKLVMEGKAAQGSLLNGGARRYPEAVVARSGNGG